MGYLTEELLNKAPFREVSEKEQSDFFVRALMEEMCFHYDNNELYRSFCDKKSFNPHEFHGELAEIPPIQVSVFKELGGRLSSVGREQIKLTLQSSATSGTPSSVPVDAITSKRQAKAMVKVIGEFIGNERKPFLVMDVDPRSGFREILGARYAAVSGYLNFASKVGYFLKVNEKGTYYFDIDGINEFIANIKEPVVVFGFTYILYSEVIKPFLEKNIQFKLPEGSKIIHIGGWKKLENVKVDKETFNKYASHLFGISENNVIDIYGFTEQMGLNYPDCPCGCKHTSLYSDVIVRDVVTKEELSCGKTGVLEFLTPIPHSYPGNAVLTDDLGELVEGHCPYNRSGKRFRILGRLKKAEIRGCGDILSNKLKFTHAEQETMGRPASTLRVSYNNGVAIDGLESNDAITMLADTLKEQLHWIRRQPVEALIGLVAQVAKKWETKSNMLSDTQKQGLAFLVKWCEPENLVMIANEGLRGNRKYIDGFISSYDSGVQSMRAVSKGLVCHWLAGNVQVLGMFVLIQSIFSKNVNLLRVSKRDNGLFEELISTFKGETYTTMGGYVITGDDLLKTIAVVYFDHNDKKAGKAMSKQADVRIAWGGSAAVTEIASYPSNIDCEDIILGPKLSFSVISKEAISDERKAKKIARKVAVDASVFDQTGCASTHNVFVERGADISPKEFCSLLATAMDKTSKQIPKGAMTAEEYAAVHSVRGIYDFKGIVYGDSESIWTVIYNDKVELNKPVYSRVVFVHAVDDMNESVQFVDENIQTIGLAAEGKKAIDYATLAAEHGANRFPACGKMLNFESPWDGMFVMDRLVKWVTLGGPFV